MRYYKVAELDLRALLEKAMLYEAYEDGGIDRWEHEAESVQEYVDNWLETYADYVRTWDDDDPRRDEFGIEDIVEEEMRMFYKNALIKETNDA